MEKNVKAHSLYRGYSPDIPAYLHNRPHQVVKQCMSKIHLAEEFSSEQVLQKSGSGEFQVKSVLQKKMSGIQLNLIPLAAAVGHGNITIYPASTSLQSLGITQNGGGRNFLWHIYVHQP